MKIYFGAILFSVVALSIGCSRAPSSSNGKTEGSQSAPKPTLGSG